MIGMPGWRTTWLSLVALAALFVCALPPVARADWAVLKNGQRLHISGYQRQGDIIVLRLYGGEATLSASQIARIDPEDIFPAATPLPAKGPYSALIAGAARSNGLDRNLLRSVIHAESNFHPRAVSAKGALGLMQLMPATARTLTVKNPFDPSENVQAGARYLKQLLDRFGSLDLALAAYNAGPARVELYRGVPPYAETRAYIARVRRGIKLPAPASAIGASEMVKVVCSPSERRCREESPNTETDAGPLRP